MVELRNIRKVFPGVVALDGVDFSVAAGEIRALMGENGAGKSTLIKVLTGVHPADAGHISLEGQAINPRSPSHAQELGISTVYQEVNLAPNLTVAENICLGSEPRKLGRINWRAVNERSREAVSRLNLEIDVTRPLSDFSTAVQQLAAIARALDREAKVLVLDEPTSSLDKAEAARLFELLRRLREQGMAIVFVTHFLDQVYEVSDSITVLRNGKLVGNWPCEQLSKHQLVAQMLGRDLAPADAVSRHEEAERPPYVQVQELGKHQVMEPVSFDVREGEVVGLSGLLGSGRTETMKLTYGAMACDSGYVTVEGKVRHFVSPQEAIRAGFGFCPEDRKQEGIFPGLSIRENMLLVRQAKRGWLRLLSAQKQKALVDEMIAQLGVKTPDSERPIEHLSGGNQQKTILARWLAAKPELLILDEPTRGIDVGSKFEIRRLIRELAANGMSFLFSSSELEEVVETCDRVVILRDRKQVGEVSGEHVNEGTIMEQMAEGGTRPGEGP